MRLGVDYYPHYFEDSNIKNDLENILKLNANCIRIGDFTPDFITYFKEKETFSP